MDERLNSWKEIAAYLRRSVHSARYWEKEEGLPVHRRHVRCRGETVYAFRKELRDWWINGASTKPASDGWLDSWKEIAVYLRRSVRSARRWEKEKGLPVQRHFHGKGDSVYAYREDLDAWHNSREARRRDQNGACATVSKAEEPEFVGVQRLSLAR